MPSKSSSELRVFLLHAEVEDDGSAAVAFWFDVFRWWQWNHGFQNCSGLGLAIESNLAQLSPNSPATRRIPQTFLGGGAVVP